MDEHEIRWGVVRRRLEAFILRTRAGAQLLSVVMFSAAAYSGYLLWTEIAQAAASYDPALRVSEKAIAWATTLAVFYGVSLEERGSLSRVWHVAEKDPPVAEAIHQVDARHGAALLCVGLLGEAVIGFVDLGRAAARPPTFDARAYRSLFFLGGLLWISFHHVWRHGLPRMSRQSHPAAGDGGEAQDPAAPSSEKRQVQVTPVGPTS